MTNVNANFKLRLGSFISGSFTDNSPLSPSLPTSPIESEIFVARTKEMRQSVGVATRSSSQIDSPYSSAHGVDIMTASIEAQQLAIVSLRQGWLVPMKAVLDDTGRLSDVARCFRLSRLLDVNAETITVEEELKNYWASVPNQKLGADLKLYMDAILKESRILQVEGSGQPENNLDRKMVELKIFYCHESLERILRSLLSIVTSLHNSSSSSDDALLQFDRLRPTLMNQMAVETLLMALPQKYSLEVIKIP